MERDMTYDPPIEDWISTESIITREGWGGSTPRIGDGGTQVIEGWGGLG